MSREIQNLLLNLEDLREKLQGTFEQTSEIANIAAELSNEWWMETATELDDFSIRIRNIVDDLDATIEEGKTMFEDYQERERVLREPDDDEENLEWENKEDIVDRIIEGKRENKKLPFKNQDY
jgi:hypothetical protein